jgi:thiamine biosynthesis lipoprotein
MRYLILLLLPLLACNRPSAPRTTEFTGTAMTINYRIVIGSPLSSDQRMRVESVIQKSFKQINDIYNKWNPDSEISALNRLPSNTPITLSNELYHFLIFTDSVVHLTEGRFDPTVEPLQQLWKNHLSNGTKPSPTEINEIKPAIGWNNIHLVEGTFSKDHADTMLDLGGIAKGYAVDLLTENLLAENFSSFYVEWGGEIKTHGRHPAKRPWRVYISRFDNTNPNEAIALLELNDEALATSGDYLQKWSVGGSDYFHILDPFSLRALEITSSSIGSASVAAKSCALADGLATAALTFSSEAEAAKWLNSIIATKHPEIRFWLLSRSSRDTH